MSKKPNKYEAILKTYGKDILVSKAHMDRTVTRVSTGSMLFDKSIGLNDLGLGGYPLGKVIEFMGPESSGKSTLCLHAIAEFQKANIGDVLLIDAEHSFDTKYAKTIGVDTDKLLLSQPDNLETAYNLTLDMAATGNVSLIIIDSHTAVPAKRRLENAIGKDEIAPEQRLHSDGLRRLTPVLSKNNCTLIGVTQYRANVGSQFGGSQGTGGNAWKFYSDIRIKIYRKTDKDLGVDNVVVETVKNKTNVPFQICEIPIKWGIGIDRIGEILDLGILVGELERRGAFYFVKGNKTNIGQGRVKTIKFLEDNAEFTSDLVKKLKDILFSQ